MKGIVDEPQYSVGLLEGGKALCDVIDNHIYEQTLVRVLTVVLPQTYKPEFLSLACFLFHYSSAFIFLSSSG